MGYYDWTMPPGCSGAPRWVEPFGLDWDRLVAPRLTLASRRLTGWLDRVKYRVRLVVAAARGEDESLW